jgi:hypothetical protein
LRRVKDKERKERKKWSYDITLLGWPAILVIFIVAVWFLVPCTREFLRQKPTRMVKITIVLQNLLFESLRHYIHLQEIKIFKFRIIS